MPSSVRMAAFRIASGPSRDDGYAVESDEIGKHLDPKIG